VIHTGTNSKNKRIQYCDWTGGINRKWHRHMATAAF
jgi:hypothetical protein